MKRQSMMNNMKKIKSFIKNRSRLLITALYAAVMIWMIIAMRSVAFREAVLWLAGWGVTGYLLLRIRDIRRNFMLGLALMTWFFLAVVQPVWSATVPDQVWQYFLSEGMLQDPKLRIRHVLYIDLYFSLLCLCVLTSYMLTDRLFSVFAGGRLTGSFANFRPSGKQRSIRLNPWIFSLFVAAADLAAEYVLNLGNGIAKSGLQIPHASMLIWLQRILLLYSFSLVMDYSLCTGIQRKSRKKLLLTGLAVLALFSIPGILLGQHGPLVLNAGELLFLWWICKPVKLIPDNLPGWKIVLYGALIFVGGSLAVLAMLGITGLARSGSVWLISLSDLYSYAFNRITGLSDGIKVIDYIDKRGTTLPLSNYFLRLLKINSAEPVSWFYVDVVLQGSHEYSGFARPAYATGLLYGGVGSICLFAILSGMICGAADRLAYYELNKKHRCNTAAILAYVMVRVFWNTTVEGNTEEYSTYLFVAIAAWLLSIMLNVRFMPYEGKKTGGVSAASDQGKAPVDEEAIGESEGAVSDLEKEASGK